MGFDSEKFILNISEDKKCALCACVLDNPVKTPCDHIFCSGCILPWVVRRGKCPKDCQVLTPHDLDNLLPLRQTILDMVVKCDFVERGCGVTFRLMDLVSHTQDCAFRPVTCENYGCGATLNAGDLVHHEADECMFRPVGICQKGCGQVLLQNNQDNHDCLEALKLHINQQELRIGTLSEDLKRQNFKHEKREKGLLGKVTDLHNDLKNQAMKFENKLSECKQHLTRLSMVGMRLAWEKNVKIKDPYCRCWPQLQTWDIESVDIKVIMLERDKKGSLGFNIMGGFTGMHTILKFLKTML
ncbi:hypothetical protein LOTGIDRAFT_164579 [Lottia gigantea]|uniref:RING-type domain-containing protein n=1 Tax=Lottia gigantea TaxID=225164 RepID=V4A4J3_LOTGI|nr:hypothetical protein LOTGIDRAFT_164579 [Lottia gigantea]ESO89885.1 hypothetical protein LOTGIDRAFT_164579 [Lottia gigantea]